MLPDYKNGLSYTPLRFRHVHDITVTATIATGVPTLVTAESSPQVAIARTGAGVYTLTFPKGLQVVYFNAVAEKSTAPAAADGTVFSCGLVNANAGTCTVWVQRPDTGAAADPADGKVRIRLELSKI